MSFVLSFKKQSKNYGGSINQVFEDVDGLMWAGNDSFIYQVNYCPITGKKATVQSADLKTTKL